MILFLIACSDTTLTTKFSNATPEATIILPDANDGGDVVEGTAVLFRAVVSDADANHNDALEARWRVDSNPEAICDYAAPDENGETSCTIDISLEMTLVTVEVIDPQNELGTDDYMLNVIITEPPEIEIINPISDGEYNEGINITFDALVSDTEDNPEELEVTWASDQSGDIELDGSVSELGFYTAEASLEEGTHIITATVSDTSGKSASETVEIVVGPIGEPVIDVIDIQDTSGMSLDEAHDGQTIVCHVEATDPDDDELTITYQWINQQGTDITIDSNNQMFQLDFAAQSLANDEILTCNGTVTDGLSTTTSSDTVLLKSCSPFANEIPYDGIDSNCDGLEYLNDLDQDGSPDDTSQDFDDDDSNAARLGLECLGEAYDNGSDTVYYLICDDDHYWKSAQKFCTDNGYESLATVHSDTEFQFLAALIASNNSIINPEGNNRDARGWLGFTRGPDCSPVSNTNSGFNSVCDTNIASYYWLDNASTSWVNNTHWFSNEGTNNVEHCAQLKLDSSGVVGMWDLYCDAVNTPPHDQWSMSHTRPSICMLRQ